MIRKYAFTLIPAVLLAQAAFGQQPQPAPPAPPLPPDAPWPAVPAAPAVFFGGSVAPVPPLPPDLGDLAMFAFQDSSRTAREAARRARDVARRDDTRDERYYREGKILLDRKEYDRAITAFNRVIDVKGSRADGALYWRAYAQNKLGQRDAALASIADLQNNYANSPWLNDAKALQVEIGQQSGKPVSPESATDEDLKLLALNSLMNSDPDRSVPMLENLLKSSNSPRLKERALFVLAQSRSAKARETLASVAKGASNPDLQAKAIEYLGIYGGSGNLQILSDVYKNSSDPQVKRTILNSFMVAKSRDNLLAAAKSETNSELKLHAIQLLGAAGGSADLAQLYSSESTPETKRAVIQGLFMSGDSAKLLELAKTEKDASLRHFIINQLGAMGRSKTGAALASMYTSETDTDNKRAIINGLFVQGNAAALVEIARKETDLNLKKQIVNELSLMHSKEASDYLMEILAK
ncbi:MAG TPA: HEAT repeat domain-containing protein [Bryobacteraceae bacterium]|nr:HEAT repeat domain-containing protein [Bryobacteraceae bacterium]